jgi:hypothetical protein
MVEHLIKAVHNFGVTTQARISSRFFVVARLAITLGKRLVLGIA